MSSQTQEQSNPNAIAATDMEANGTQVTKPEEVTVEDEQDKAKKGCNWRYWGVRLVILTILLLVIVLAIIFRSWVRDTITTFLEWLGNNPGMGTVCLSLVYIVATLAWIPGSLLTLGAGVALNSALESTALAILVGTIGVWVGAWIGSNLAMLLGRYLFRDSAANLAKKYRVMNAIDKVLEKEGLKFTILLRLCPLIPFNAFNYIMGVTSVKFKAYAIGGLGMIPGTIVYVFVGTTIGNIADAASGEFEGGTVTLVLLIVGTVLAFAAIVYITIVVKRYLNKQLAENAKQEAEMTDKPESQREMKQPDASISKNNKVSPTQSPTQPKEGEEEMHQAL